jgi:cell division protein FtsX
VIRYPQPSSLSQSNAKEPLENASHVRNAVARFKQVKGVTEAERRAAWKRIQSAAKQYGVELEESD